MPKTKHLFHYLILFHRENYNKMKNFFQILWYFRLKLIGLNKSSHRWILGSSHDTLFGNHISKFSYFISLRQNLKLNQQFTNSEVCFFYNSSTFFLGPLKEEFSVSNGIFFLFWICLIKSHPALGLFSLEKMA